MPHGILGHFSVVLLSNNWGFSSEMQKSDCRYFTKETVSNHWKMINFDLKCGKISKFLLSLKSLSFLAKFSLKSRIFQQNWKKSSQRTWKLWVYRALNRGAEIFGASTHTWQFERKVGRNRKILEHVDSPSSETDKIAMFREKINYAE